MKFFQCSVVGNRNICEPLGRQKLLGGRITARQLAFLFLNKLVQCPGGAFPAARLASFETNPAIGFSSQESKVLSPAQDFDFRGVSDGVHHNVARPLQTREYAFSKNPRPRSRPQFVTDINQSFAGNFSAPASNFFSDLVRE